MSTAHPRRAVAARPHARRSRLVRTAALLAVVAPLVGVVPSPALAAPANDELPVSVAVTAVTPSVLTPGQDLRISVTVRNDGDTELTRPSAVLRLSRMRPVTSAELDAWVDAESQAGAGSAVGRPVPIEGPLAPGASTEVTFEVPASSVGLLDTPDAWGPRGIAVELVDGRRRVGIERTFLLWLPDSEDLPQTRLSVLVPLVASAPGAGDASATSAEVPAPEATEPAGDAPGTAPADDPTAEATEDAPPEAAEPADPVLEAQTGPDGRLRTLLEVSGASTGISWALDPALTERAAAAGPQSSRWLDDLVGAADDRDVLSLPWADPDLGALAHAERADLLAAATAAAADADPLGTGSLPTVQWAPEPVPDLAVAALAAGSDVPAMVVGPQALAPERTPETTPGAVTTVSTDAGPLAALVPDPTLSGLLTEPRRTQPGATQATLTQRLLAETAVVAHEERDTVPHVLAAVPRDWSPDVEMLTAAVRALDDAPWVRLAPASELLTTEPDPTEREALPGVNRAPGELSRATVNALADARNAAVSFAAVLEDPAKHLDGLDQGVLVPLAVAWRSDVDGRRTVVDAALADATARRGGLSVVLGERVTSVSSESPFRFAVRSTLDQAATVRVELRPRKGCLEVEETPTAVVAPGTEQTIRVELSANANCDVLVDVFVLAPDGTSVATAGRFHAHVSPTIENVGTAVVGVLLALGLVLGIVRTVRRGQTARRGARLAAQAVPGDESETTG